VRPRRRGALRQRAGCPGAPALRRLPLRRYFNDHADTEPFKSLTGAAERAAFVAELHKLKTELFVQQVERGELPLRPGVARLVAEAREAGVKARRRGGSACA
jgi:hypothetical protein